ncbi:IQ and AAA domain-containing protein 1-like isoform X3 [Artemia franciscana]|uniref:IQ and AAA domain-containing protein 1-like isoform X3 n=1 Tax=Artemia franciscana TaxID=6661 RepID=UPI0032DAE416
MSQTSPSSSKKRGELLEKVQGLYLAYCQIAHMLDSVYTHLCQPQKRLFVKKVLDSVILRGLELRNEICALSFTEAPNLDEIVFQKPYDISNVGLPIPKHFRLEREERHLGILIMIQGVFDKIGRTSHQDDLCLMSLEEAVKLIQVHERARQGRVRAQLMLQIRRKAEKSLKPSSVAKQTSEEKAALRIQAVWRSFKVRKFVKDLRDSEMIFLGMKRIEDYDLIWTGKAEKILVERDSLKKGEAVRFQEASALTYEKIINYEEQKMKEYYEDRLRNYFLKYFKATGKLPDIPKDEDGGSEAIDFNYFPRHEDDSKQRKSPLYGTVPKVGKKRSKKSKKKSGKTEDKASVKEVPKKLLQFQPSRTLGDINASAQRYKEQWLEKDLRQKSLEDSKYDEMLLIEEKRKEIMEDIRRAVDSKMRKQLDILRAALERDLGKKRPRKVVRLRRGGRKSKKKREKDLTPDRTLESLVEELATYGIIRPPKNIEMADLIGEMKFVPTKNGKSLPSFRDVKQAFIEMCLLPLGSKEMRLNAPFLRSLLIAGPRSCGKASLVHALCNEVGAVLFDISPQNLTGKYPGKAGLAMLFHLLLKVSRAVQPAIIFIEEIDKVLKKTSKSDRGFESGKRIKKDLPKLIKSISSEDRVIVVATSNQPWECEQKVSRAVQPAVIFIEEIDKVLKKTSKSDRGFESGKRIKKDLPKLIKSISSEDRVIVVATSNQPWECEQKALFAMFQKCLHMGIANYSHRYKIWTEQIRQILTRERCIAGPEVDITALARITDGYSSGSIVRCISQTLSERRLSKLPYQPIKAAEFIPELSKLEPVYKFLVTIEPGRSLLHFVTTNCLIWSSCELKLEVASMYLIVFYSLSSKALPEVQRGNGILHFLVAKDTSCQESAETGKN